MHVPLLIPQLPRELEIEFAHGKDQSKLDLHHGQLLSNAGRRAVAETTPGAFYGVQYVAFGYHVSLGNKGVDVGPEVRSAVESGGTGRDHEAVGRVASSILIVVDELKAWLARAERRC